MEIMSDASKTYNYYLERIKYNEPSLINAAEFESSSFKYLKKINNEIFFYLTMICRI
jgi:hypothetical protein